MKKELFKALVALTFFVVPAMLVFAPATQARRIGDELMTIGHGRVLIAGTINTAAGGTVASQVPTSQRGFTASRSGTGVYRITLPYEYPELVGAFAVIEHASSTIYKVKLSADNVSNSNKYVEFTTMSLATTATGALDVALSAYGVLPHFAADDAITDADATTDNYKPLAGALLTWAVAHDNDTTVHASSTTDLANASWTSAPSNPADLAETIAALNELKSDWNTHIANGTAGTVHKGPDNDSVVSSSDAATETSVVTLANEMKGDFNRSGAAGFNTDLLSAGSYSAADVASGAIHFVLILRETAVAQ